MMKRDIYLSVVIPVYNERKRVNRLSSVVNYLRQQEYSFEILVVDDGSKDLTATMVRKMKFKELRLISYKPNKGKGAAVKEGMLRARGKYRLFMDVDLSTPIEEVEKFLREQKTKNVDVVIGTRKDGVANVEVHQPILREMMGKVFTFLSRKVLGVNVSDFTCGFKMFSEKASKEIFSRSLVERWGFDAEIIYLSSRLGYKIKEIPVTWRDDPNTKVKFPKDALESLRDLFRVVYVDKVLRGYDL